MRDDNLWLCSRPGGPVAFDFRMGREREGPKRFLGNSEGILQSDGYGVDGHVEMFGGISEGTKQ
jgi:Transposase IS66 family